LNTLLRTEFSILIRDRGEVVEVLTVSSYFRILEPPKMILEDYE